MFLAPGGVLAECGPSSESVRFRVRTIYYRNRVKLFMFKLRIKVTNVGLSREPPPNGGGLEALQKTTKNVILPLANWSLVNFGI